MLKIGETFIYENVTLIVNDEINLCEGCFFNRVTDDGNCGKINIPETNCCNREDWVIFTLYESFKFGK
jgi:hypothetical protein